jgi:hypothetical protein
VVLSVKFIKALKHKLSALITEFDQKVIEKGVIEAKYTQR